MGSSRVWKKRKKLNLDYILSTAGDALLMIVSVVQGDQPLS